MAGSFDVDLITRIPQVDKKVRLVGLYKRREREGRKERGSHPKEGEAVGVSTEDAGEKRIVDITV
ncbi:MAG: hypothetical protein ABIN58_08390 [candidate division WOR-3 bacterium]